MVYTFSQPILAQTKLIAHKSQGGSNATFSEALKTDVRLRYSSYGAAPLKFVSNASLDSVIFIDDTTCVMITSYYNTPELASNQRLIEPHAYYDLEGNLLPWEPGTDTVFRHEVFSSEMTISQMKRAVDERYFFQNNESNIIFLNFPKNQLDSVKKNRFPILNINSDKFWPGAALLFLVAVFGSFLAKRKQLTIA